MKSKCESCRHNPTGFYDICAACTNYSLYEYVQRNPYKFRYSNATLERLQPGADLPLIPKITRVIFNDPATIVFWEDGTKTVVKAHDEEFDPEKGLAMAITKKALGNDSYYPEIKKWTKTYYEKEDAPQDNPGMIIFNGIKRLSDEAVENLSSLLGTEGWRENVTAAVSCMSIMRAMIFSRITDKATVLFWLILPIWEKSIIHMMLTTSALSVWRNLLLF